VKLVVPEWLYRKVYLDTLLYGEAKPLTPEEDDRLTGDIMTQVVNDVVDTMTESKRAQGVIE
jgi:hypothetical protein